MKSKLHCCFATTRHTSGPSREQYHTTYIFVLTIADQRSAIEHNSVVNEQEAILIVLFTDCRCIIHIRRQNFKITPVSFVNVHSPIVRFRLFIFYYSVTKDSLLGIDDLVNQNATRRVNYLEFQIYSLNGVFFFFSRKKLVTTEKIWTVRNSFSLYVTICIFIGHSSILAFHNSHCFSQTLTPLHSIKSWTQLKYFHLHIELIFLTQSPYDVNTIDYCKY